MRRKRGVVEMKIVYQIKIIRYDDTKQAENVTFMRSHAMK